LPHLSNESLIYSPTKQKGFSCLQLLNNIEWLKTVLGANDPLVRYVDTLTKEWEEDISEVQEASWIKKTIEKRMGVRSSYNEEADYAECRKVAIKCMKEKTAKDEKPLLFLSDTHTTTEIVLNSYKELNPMPDIGVICFDAHADLYDPTKELWKGNVFSILLEKNIISCVLFVGVPIFRQMNIISEISEKIEKRISFLDWKKTDQEIELALSKFIGLSPTNIFYSFDIDGLDSRKEKYTAMEYCSFHILTKLAEKDFTTETDKDKLTKMLRDCVMQPVKDLSNPENVACKNLLKIGDEGVSLDEVYDIIHKIEAFAHINNIQIGLPLPQDSLLVGDIVELFGPDLKEKTAYAVSEIAKSLTADKTLKF